MSDNVALCPSCGQRKYSAARATDGLCDECAGRGAYAPFDSLDEAAEAQELIEREGEPPLCPECKKGYLARTIVPGQLMCQSCGTHVQAACECAWHSIGTARRGCPVCCPTGDPTDPHGTQRR
jgi:ribosomal protein L37AE/L43A